ncbi:MAG TPA: diacylglycerol kinase family protein [Chloroflexota bacterium]
MSLQRLQKSFGHAVNGLAYLFRTQPNAHIHVAVAAGVLVLSALWRVTLVELALVLLAIGLVLVAEAMNSAVEAAVDVATREIHPRAREAKDVAAAGVLVAAATSVAIGALVFGPRLLALLRG